MHLIQTTLLSQILTTLPDEIEGEFGNYLDHYRETFDHDNKYFNQNTAGELIHKLQSDFGNLNHVVKSSGIYPAKQIYFQLTNIKASLPIAGVEESKSSSFDRVFPSSGKDYTINENIQIGDSRDQNVGLDFYSTYEPGDVDADNIVLVQIQFKKYKSRQNMGWSLKQAAHDFMRFGVRPSGVYEVCDKNADVANAYTIMTYRSVVEFAKEIELIGPALNFLKTENN